MTLTLTERQRARMLAIVRAEQSHTQALRMMCPRRSPGLVGTLADIAEDLGNIADLLTKGQADENV